MQPDTIASEIASDSITRAVSAVFRQAEYRRTVRRSLLQEMYDWFSAIVRSIESTIDAHPVLQHVLAAIALLLIAAIFARVVYVRRMHDLTTHRLPLQRINALTEDPWVVAQRSAREQNYQDAAHALYLAVLQSLARSDRVVIDSAKTVGDYTGELRRASSSSLSLYRDFARHYEPVVWGSHSCDERQFDLLLGIASRMAGRRA